MSHLLCVAFTPLSSSVCQHEKRSEGTKAYVCLCGKHDQAIDAAQRQFQSVSCLSSYIINRMRIYGIGVLSLMLCTKS